MNNLEAGIVAALRADGSVSATAQQTVFAPDKLVAGQQESGYCGVMIPATAGSSIGAMVNFKTQMTNVPTNISASSVFSSNFNNLAVTDFSVYGFTLHGNVIASGTAEWHAIYTTVGN